MNSVSLIFCPEVHHKVDRTIKIGATHGREQTVAEGVPQRRHRPKRFSSRAAGLSKPAALQKSCNILSRQGLAQHRVRDADADLTERTQLRADLIAAMARNLDAREGRLMRLRYGLSDGNARSLQECAESMGLSYARVQQLSKICLLKLRQAAEAESLEEYLLTIA